MCDIRAYGIGIQCVHSAVMLAQLLEIVLFGMLLVRWVTKFLNKK